MILALTPKRRKTAYLLSTLFERPLPPPAGEPVDVVIPVVPKDLGILPLCLEGIRHSLNHPVVLKIVKTPALTGERDTGLAALPVYLELHIPVQKPAGLLEITHFHGRHLLRIFKGRPHRPQCMGRHGQKHLC